jgi:MATE family multidrug resistance protein
MATVLLSAAGAAIGGSIGGSVAGLSSVIVGRAVGARNRAMLRRSVIVSTGAAAVLSLGFMAAMFALQGPLIRLFTNVEDVRLASHLYYFWAAGFPVVAVLAYQMDGVFVGATEGAAMRNGMIVSAAIYFAISWWLADVFANHGVWAGIWVFLALRGLTLLAQYPRLERHAGET